MIVLMSKGSKKKKIVSDIFLRQQFDKIKDRVHIWKFK